MYSKINIYLFLKDDTLDSVHVIKIEYQTLIIVKTKLFKQMFKLQFFENQKAETSKKK